jgi:hypothetical protein
MRVSHVALPLAMLLALSACGGGDSSGSSSTTTNSSSSTSSTSGGPTISTQPGSQTVNAGSSVSFTVVATGSGTLAYQWYKGTTGISGATGATFALTTVAVSDAGSYYVTVTNSAGSVTSSTATLTVNTTTSGCTGGTYVANVVCAANAFEATLTSTQLATAQYSNSSFTSAQLNVYKTLWSNLPGVNRAGIALSALTTSAQTAAFYAVADAALTDAGYNDFLGVLAADNYLGTIQGGYGASFARIAIIGTPSTTGQWTLQLGNHHLAFNITFYNGSAYPTPHHIGVEPKASFTYSGMTYQVLADKAAAVGAIFAGQTDSLSPTTAGSTALTAARLTATYTDILIGPVEYNTGSYTAVAAKFPTSNRGTLVSSLTTAQQALVTAAITKYVSDYDPTISAYTSASAYASTYVAWSAASSQTYPNVDVANSYLRIDGPRVWIEIACQGGIVIQGATHYHMMFRDKERDYYNELSN